MTGIACTLVCHSLGRHVQQVHTGFHELHARGLIDLTQRPVRCPAIDPAAPQHLRDARLTHLTVVLNGTLRLLYDLHDAMEIDARELERCDFYFKRSYSRAAVEPLGPQRDKVHPLGLNYHVLPSTVDPGAVARSLVLGRGFAGRLEALQDALDTRNVIRFRPRARLMEALPDLEAPPRVLFLVTAYDPYDDPDRPVEKSRQMEAINGMRAACIRALRNSLGPDVLAGFLHNRITTERYADLLVPDPEVTRKGRYVEALRAHPIGVATTGLHGSIGWKFGEYVAFSRAIVSEPLQYEVPGGLAAGRNYVEFTTPEACVEQARRLLTDHELRRHLMIENARYYHAHLRPDALVMNSLLTALLATRG